jgi:hypothetical protein
MDVQFALAEVNKHTLSNSGGTNRMEMRSTKDFEETTHCKRGDEFDAYH